MIFDLLVEGGMVLLPTGQLSVTDIGIRNGRIAAIGLFSRDRTAKTFLNARGLHVLPGVIDTQVHFREPGFEDKEDLTTGSLAAVLGGVTTVCEMPNTKPATITDQLFNDKLARASDRMACNYAFFLGATTDNVEQLATWESMTGCAGIKVFMGSSTGDLLVKENTALTRILRASKRRIAVHCEDEDRLRRRYHLFFQENKEYSPNMHPVWRDVKVALFATSRLLTLAKRMQKLVHILHLSTAEEVTLLRRYRDIATAEVTPHHLTLVAPFCYERLGTKAQVNPPIREARHCAALWRAVNEGVVDCLGSDHAPHTLQEKQKPYPYSPSGVPGVQTLVPVMLTHVSMGRLSLPRFVALTSAGPANLYKMTGKGYIAAGYDGDLTLVDLQARHIIDRNWLASRCGWSPFEEMTAVGWPVATIVRGHVAMYENSLSPIFNGTPLIFS